MTYRLFIDDERHPPVGEEFVVVRSSTAAVFAVQSRGLPFYISFDHDLGGEDTSMVFLKWLEVELCTQRLTFPENFQYYVHSQNPVGKQNIINYMQSLLKHFV